MTTKNNTSVNKAIKTATKFWLKSQIDLGKTQKEVLELFATKEVKDFIKENAVKFYMA